MQSQGKRRVEDILYALTELLLLRGQVSRVPHRPVMLHDPLLESADAALRNAEAGNNSAVHGVLLHVAHQFERDDPQSEKGDKGETALTEDGLQHGTSMCRRSNHISVLAGCNRITRRQKEKKIREKASRRYGVMTHSSAQRSSTSHIHVLVRPIGAEAELSRGICDKDLESLLRIGKTERVALGHE